MRLLLNPIWLVLAGSWLFLGCGVAALICFVPRASTPCGRSAAWWSRSRQRNGVDARQPFGRRIVTSEQTAAAGYPGGAFVQVLAGRGSS